MFSIYYLSFIITTAKVIILFYRANFFLIFPSFIPKQYNKCKKREQNRLFLK